MTQWCRPRSSVPDQAEHYSRLTIAQEPRVVRDDADLAEAVKAMSEVGVRRLPVIAADGALFGVVTLDDVLRVLAAEPGALALALGREREQEEQQRRRL